MVYTTVRNIRKIINGINPSQLKLNETIGFSQGVLNLVEEQVLFNVKEFLVEPRKFCNEIVIPYLENNRINYDGATPSYHSFGCIHLCMQNHLGVYIPQEFKNNRGKRIDFTEWLLSVRNLMCNPDIFSRKLLEDWKIVIPRNELTIICQTFVDKNEISLELLETKIQYLINEYISFSKIHPDIEANGLTDKIFDIYKKPLKEYLLEYYRIMYNPTMEIEKEILDNIGLRHCNICKYH